MSSAKSYVIRAAVLGHFRMNWLAGTDAGPWADDGGERLIRARRREEVLRFSKEHAGGSRI